MDYTEITDLAISFGDHTDVDTTSRIDKFILLVEARVNRYLKTQDMTARAQIVTNISKDYYGLPSDFAGMRLLSVPGDKKFRYLTPEKMVDVQGLDMAFYYFTVVAKQLRIYPKLDAKTMELVYLRKVPNLTALAPTNWISDNHPDLYIFGLLVEISSFNKDAEAKALWDDRFKETLEMIDIDDATSLWSSSTMETRLG